VTYQTPGQRDSGHDTTWAEAEVTEFTQALADFRDSLTARQREAMDGILAFAGANVSGADVHGYASAMAWAIPRGPAGRSLAPGDDVFIAFSPRAPVSPTAGGFAVNEPVGR
jgi:hypothetical protein